MLPGNERVRVDDDNVLRFGVFAMERMINELLKLGSSRSALRVKVCGGATIVPGAQIGIGNQNFVREYVTTERLQLVSEDLGGTQARRVLFYPDTGRLRIKRLSPLEVDELQTLEERYASRVGETAQEEDDVELF